MTTREFFAKHYGSLSVALFAAGLLAAIAEFGGGIGALTSPRTAEPVAEAPEVAVESQPASPNPESPPAPDETAASTQNSSAQTPADEAAQREKEEEEQRAALTAGAEPESVDPTPENTAPLDPSAQPEPKPAAAK